MLVSAFSTISRLANLTNHPPDDHSARLAEAQRELLTVKSPSRRSEVQQIIKDLETIISPIRRIPNELLCDIFSLAAGELDVFDEENLAYVLIQVCTHWRTVAISCTELWAQMQFLTSQSNRPDDFLLRMAQTALDRAGPARLIDLQLIQCRPSLQSNLLKLLLSRATSWRSVMFQGWGLSALGLLTTARDKWDNLESLAFEFCVFKPFLWREAFRRCPRLHKVNGPLELLQSLIIPWGQITECEVDNIYSADYVDLIRKADRLTVFRTSPETDHSWPANGGPPVEHSSLRLLSVNNSVMLSELTLPSLDELNVTLKGRLERIHDSLTNLHSFFIRSSCRLQKLHFQSSMNHDITEAELFAILDCVPALTQLSLKFDDLSKITIALVNRLARQLTIHEGDEVDDIFMPRLESLRLDMYVGVSQDSMSEDFMKMVWSRRVGPKLPDGVVQLQEFHLMRTESLGSPPLLTRVFLKKLEDLRKGGFKVSVLDAGEDLLRPTVATSNRFKVQ
ncbi:hypothetical protein C8J56DRAFT_290973 [Mycena floridula]|nr:hypothetical protein C8J56DRAFT_290973 [Mycena floridula]